MLKAHELQAQGLTQKQIAAQLGKTAQPANFCRINASD